jgi:hypothetical protein
MRTDQEETVAVISRQSAGAALVFAILSVVPAAAQSDHPLEVFLGWAPIFADQAENHVLPAWALSVSGGGVGSLSLALDVSGWYCFGCTGSVHNFLGGPRYNFPGTNGVRGFAQVLAGATVFHAYGTALGMAVVPGGGADVPVLNHRFAIRIQGDYFGMYSPGDYGRHYWGHVWRASTGLVFRPK